MTKLATSELLCEAVEEPFLQVCNKCREEKISTAFTISRRAKSGRFPSCRECVRKAHAANPEIHRAASRKFIERNREAINAAHRAFHAAHPEVKANQRYKRVYGITSAEKTAMISAQGGICAICGTDRPGKKGFHVDHCHQTGGLRKCLCGPCNMGLGHLKDSPQILADSLVYLKDHGRTLPPENLAFFIDKLNQ